MCSDRCVFTCLYQLLYPIRIYSWKNLFYKTYFHIVLDIFYKFLQTKVSALKTISTAIQTLIFSSISLQNETDTALSSVNTFITVKSLCSSSFRQIRIFIITYTPKCYYFTLYLQNSH